MDKTSNVAEGLMSTRFGIMHDINVINESMIVMVTAKAENKVLVLETGYDKREDRNIRIKMEDIPMEYAEYLWNKYPQYIEDKIEGRAYTPHGVDNLL